MAWFSDIKNTFQSNRFFSKLIIAGTFVLILSLIMPQNYVSYQENEVGRIWQSGTLYAPFDFFVMKNAIAYQNEKDSLQKSVYEIYDVEVDPLKRESSFAELLQDCLAAIENRASRIAWIKLMESYQIETSVEEFLKIQAYEINKISNLSQLIYSEMYTRGITDRLIREIKGNYIAVRKSESQENLIRLSSILDKENLPSFIESRLLGITPQAKSLIFHIIIHSAIPNLIFNAALYENEQKQIQHSSSRFNAKIHKGEIIIQKGQIVTPEVKDTLDSLNKEKEEEYSWFHFFITLLGEIIVYSGITLGMLLFLRANRRSIYYRNESLIFLLVLFLLMVILILSFINLSEIVVSIFKLQHYYVAPVCIAPILFTIFFDDRVAFACHTLFTLTIASVVTNSFEFFFIHYISGLVAIYSLSLMRTRSQFFTTSGLLLLSYSIAYIGFQFFITGNVSNIQFQNMYLLVVNVMFTLLTYPLVYFIEKMFGISSDLTYIELLDTKHPLLNELSIHAPGTYQHSLQVANISETVAYKIGANGLQVRAAALFHDIGKLKSPEFFTENEEDRSAHSIIDPLQSARIIISHVEEGVKLAQQYKLPNEIIDFIRTHHGNTRVEYFYRKYMATNLDKNVDESKFRYPGPLPYTKEQAVLMIADSAEAASRSLDNPTPDELMNLVENIVAAKIQDNQLIYAHITFRDLNKIKTEIQKLLINIYHKRIKYPGQQ